jgi:hypothetical protein
MRPKRRSKKPIAAWGSSIRSESKTTAAQAVRYSTKQKARPPIMTGPLLYGCYCCSALWRFSATLAAARAASASASFFAALR